MGGGGVGVCGCITVGPELKVLVGSPKLVREDPTHTTENNWLLKELHLTSQPHLIPTT